MSLEDLLVWDVLRTMSRMCRGDAHAILLGEDAWGSLRICFGGDMLTHESATLFGVTVHRVCTLPPFSVVAVLSNGGIETVDDASEERVRRRIEAGKTRVVVKP